MKKMFHTEEVIILTVRILHEKLGYIKTPDY